MGWAGLPITEGAFSLNANILANSVGSSIDDLFDIALAKDAVLTDAIADISSVLGAALDALSATYSATLTGGAWSTPTTAPAVPDLSGSFGSALSAPGDLTLTEFGGVSDPEASFPTAPTLADPPGVTEPTATFPASVDPGDVPTLATGPTAATITPDFPSLGTLPDVPTFDDAPTLGALDAMATAPTAPTTGNVLSDAAYTDAFALANAESIATETSGLWEAEFGSAANGIGLPFAAAEAMMDAVRTQRRKSASKSALELSRQKADHQRDDTKWAYEQRLAYWTAIESATVSRWQSEQTTKISLWAQASTQALSIYSTQMEVALKAFSIGTEAERARLAALISVATYDLEQWVKSSELALSYWSSPAEVKSNLFSAEVQAASAQTNAQVETQKLILDEWRTSVTTEMSKYQTGVQAESTRVSSFNEYQKLLVDSWSQQVDAEVKKYQAEGQLDVSVADVNARLASQRIQAETARFQATIQNLQTELQAKAEERNWWATKDQSALTDAQQKAVDAREIQKIIAETGKQATYAYAGAVAEQFKAWCSQISYGVSTGSSVSNVTYAGG